MKVAEFLGQKASSLLEAEPFNHWPVKRRLINDSDPPEERYIFSNGSFEVICDPDDDKIRTVFIHVERHSGTILSDVPFNFSRKEVLLRFGPPAKSGERLSHPVFGDSGSWDRFQLPRYTLHVEYKVDTDSIKMITLMRNDVVPGA